MATSGNGTRITGPGRAMTICRTRTVNIAVFLDEVTAANSPLLFIPGSDKLGIVDADHDLETTSYPPPLDLGPRNSH